MKPIHNKHIRVYSTLSWEIIYEPNRADSGVFSLYISLHVGAVAILCYPYTMMFSGLKVGEASTELHSR